jgi:hypothetical protein
MYQQGERITQKGLLAAADALDEVNRRELDSRYASVQASSWLVLVEVVLLALVLLAMLAALQFFLYRRMHRVLNPVLLGATVLTAGFLIYTLVAFLSVSHSLKVAKQDAFDSIHFLRRAQAEAYDANGEESRWLLDDNKQRDTDEKAFRDKAGRLVTLPSGMTFAQLVDLVHAGKVPAGFKGYVADELRNITFVGEQAAANDTLAKFGQYLDIDAKIRKLENEGQHAEAVKLCIGYNKGESNWAFQQFDEALGKTLKINDDAFHSAIDQGEATLGIREGGMAIFTIAAAVVALAVAVLTYVGLRPRFREYAV